MLLAPTSLDFVRALVQSISCGMSVNEAVVCRFFLGMCEGSITAGFLIITSMFYTHIEATRRVGF
jgi:hypothetical protein